MTINTLRRSFRDTFLDTSKPVKGREHQPLWFIDVKEENKKRNDERLKSSGSIYGYHPSDDNFNKNAESNSNKRPSSTTSIRRNETFRVDEKPSKYSGLHSSISRKNTFRVNEEKQRPKLTYFEQPDSPVPDVDREYKITPEPTRADILNATERAGKVVPVAITAPYSALNDISARSSSKPSLYSQFNSERPSSRNDITVIPYGHDTVDHPSPRLKANLAENSVTFINGAGSTNSSDLHSRHKRSDLASPLSSRANLSPKVDIKNTPNRTIIEIRPCESSPDYSGSPTPRDPNYLSMNNKYISARQSFRDLKAKPETSTTPFRIGSFRSILTRTSDDPTNTYRSTNGISTFSSPLFDRSDHNTDSDSGNFNKTQWTNQSWRNISTRPFTNGDSSVPSSSSFVPYYKINADNNDSQPDTDSQIINNNNNRTTININFNHNSNASPTKELQRNTNITRNNEHNNQYDNDDPHTFRKSAINLPSKTTSSLKVPTNASKEKQNKNRSVNFPSVEYEVRLISPSYDSKKPLRKPGQRTTKTTSSANNNDWTFNKVHL